MSTPSLFDAFFWIEPVKGSNKNSVRSLLDNVADVLQLLTVFRSLTEYNKGSVELSGRCFQCGGRV
jgi:hypothetical protein